jgi:betaine lipid synthase
VIPPFHAAVDRATSYLDPAVGLLGVADFYVPSRYDLPLRQMTWLRRFFWRCALCLACSSALMLLFNAPA